jgi:hypothetical protein
MALAVLTQPHPSNFFEPVRSRFLTNLGIPVKTRDRTAMPRPAHVVYVDRQATNRRLTEDSHLAVVAVLDRLEAEGSITWVHGKFGEMPVHDQVEVTAAADVSVT